MKLTLHRRYETSQIDKMFNVFPVKEAGEKTLLTRSGSMLGIGLARFCALPTAAKRTVTASVESSLNREQLKMLLADILTSGVIIRRCRRPSEIG